MLRRTSILFGLICLIAISAVSASAQIKAEVFKSMSRYEMETLIADLARSNPMAVQKLADPAGKKEQIESFKQLLAFASQAVNEGMASDPINKQELENISAEIVAINYDRELNKGKAARRPFGYITADAVNAYWANKDVTLQRTNEAAFSDFLNAKMGQLKASSPEMKDIVISDDEKNQARDNYTRIQIYKSEYEQKLKSGTLLKEFVDKTNLQVKLQQAQFLTRLYSEKVANQTAATDAEVEAYFAAHPDLEPTQKRALAEEILDRATAGENFATLANKYSEDPGNIGANGAPSGGIYIDVLKGTMMVPFETAALALKAGQVSPELVETDRGFHIIKLERTLGKKKASSEATYDVRHILISTDIEDPDDPSAPQKPAKEFARNKVETAKEKVLIDKLVAANNIQVSEDFVIPTVVTEPVKKTTPPKRKN